MKKQIVLLHGRPPVTADAKTFRTQWLDAWSLGLKRAGLSTPDADIRFAYYGDLLDKPTEGRTPDEFVDAASDADPQDEEFRHRMLDQVAANRDVINFQPRGIPAREKVRRLMQALAECEGINTRLVFQLIEDAYRYLTDATLRARVVERIRGHIDPDRPAIFVSHALGTVVAYDLLSNTDSNVLNVPLLVTLASPLGFAVIREKMRVDRLPGSVALWCNARDPEDIVALFPLDSTHFPLPDASAILDKSDVLNRSGDHHAIQGYLNDPDVVRWIHYALR